MSNLAVLMWIFVFISYHVNGYTNITCNNDNRCWASYYGIMSCNDPNGCHFHCYDMGCSDSNFVADNVNTFHIYCYDHRSCHMMNLNISLVNEADFVMNCLDVESCQYSNVIINRNGNNTSNITSYINCLGSYACFDTSFVITNMNDVHVDCDGYWACSHTGFTPTNTNQFNIDCINGISVCWYFVVNGISANNINVTCTNGQCGSMEVYCPINPFKMSNNYEISNIDPDSCYIDLNNGAQNSEIFSVYGLLQTNLLNTGSIGNGIKVFCDFDWFHVYDYDLQTQIDQICFDINNVQTSIISKLSNNETIVKTSQPYSNEISCYNENNNCIMYILQQYNPINTIMCPNGDYTCSIICFNEDSCSNAYIDGSRSKDLTITTLERADKNTGYSTIYCPIGNNTECNIISDDAWWGYEYSIIHANQTETLSIIASGDFSFGNVTIYARNVNYTRIECISDYSCEGLRIYIYDHEFGLHDNIFETRLTINCAGIDSCLNAQVITESRQNIHKCQWDINQWQCNTSKMPPKKDDSDSDSDSTYNVSAHIPWIISGFIAGLCIVVTCGFICFCIYYHHQKSTKKINGMNRNIPQQNINSTSNTTDSNKRNNDSVFAASDIPLPQSYPHTHSPKAHQKHNTELMYDNKRILSANKNGKDLQNVIHTEWTGKRGEISPAMSTTSVQMNNNNVIPLQNPVNPLNNNGHDIIIRYDDENDSNDDIEIITNNSTTHNPGNV